MGQEFGLKELEQVVIKTTSNIEINGRSFIPGETIAILIKFNWRILMK